MTPACTSGSVRAADVAAAAIILALLLHAVPASAQPADEATNVTNECRVTVFPHYPSPET